MNYDESPTPWWRLPFWVVLIGFMAVGGFFLVTEHRAHLFGVLPFLLFLACPLMHFMHHGHGGHGGHRPRSEPSAGGSPDASYRH
jgi:hypothetical protein